jgi:predicted Zn-dependent protease with MMP-like domain
MRNEDFERLMEEGFGRIPEKFRQKIKNVALVLEEELSLEIRNEQKLGNDETLFGLYVGVPNTERGDNYGIGATMPDKIIIFKKPIEEEAGGDLEKIREIVAETIWHEFAHYFGMDEDEVRGREGMRRSGK